MMAVTGSNPEKQVLKLSKSVGPQDLPVPAAGASTLPPAALTADPFENRKEVRPGKNLPDSTRPVDAPAVQK